MSGKRKHKTPPKLVAELDELEIGSRKLQPGMTVRLHGERGEWRIKRIDAEPVALTVYGGSKGREMVRTFPLDKFKSIVRKTRAHAEALDAAAAE